MAYYSLQTAYTPLGWAALLKDSAETASRQSSRWLNDLAAGS